MTPETDIPQVAPQIETASGAYFNFLSPEPGAVTVADIGSALSKLCRYTGHASRFYSVAEHCVHVAELLATWNACARLQFLGLLHDAAEAYVGDVNKPLKQLLPYYRRIEHDVQRVVWTAAGICPPSEIEQAEIKDADRVLLMTEAAALLPSHGRGWATARLAQADPNIVLWYYLPDSAKSLWLQAYDTFGHAAAQEGEA